MTAIKHLIIQYYAYMNKASYHFPSHLYEMYDELVYQSSCQHIEAETDLSPCRI